MKNCWREKWFLAISFYFDDDNDDNADNDDNDDNSDDNYRIDESITYLQANSNYKESTVYLGTVHSTYYIIST